jgi:hypothetical protein
VQIFALAPDFQGVGGGKAPGDGHSEHVFTPWNGPSRAIIQPKRHWTTFFSVYHIFQTGGAKVEFDEHPCSGYAAQKSGWNQRFSSPGEATDILLLFAIILFTRQDGPRVFRPGEMIRRVHYDFFSMRPHDPFVERRPEK